MPEEIHPEVKEKLDEISSAIYGWASFGAIYSGAPAD